MYNSILSTLALLAVANAHFAIQNPVPIAGASTKSPLDPSGSDFPCHGADLSSGTVTDLKAGSSYPLEFNLGGGANTAVHGGGSCQLSLTYETDAAKLRDPASWKVIKSYVGGCPTDAKGNLPSAVMCASNGGECVNSLNFQVPSEVKNGAAIFAFTWFNNIGNREMYMNCARVSVTGGSDALSSLPSLFVANIAALGDCHTSEQQSVDFPNPGKYVQRDPSPNYPIKAPGGNCGSGSGSANVASSSPSGNSNGVIGNTPAAASSPKAASNPGGIFAPGAAGSASSSASAAPAVAAAAGGAAPTPAAVIPAAAAATTLATVAVPASTPAASPAQAQAAAAAPASPKAAASPSQKGSCSNGAISCSVSGFFCIDATHFALCDFGCGIPMAVASGTKCVGGAIAAGKKAKRSHRHFAARGIHGGSF